MILTFCSTLNWVLIFSCFTSICEAFSGEATWYRGGNNACGGLSLSTDHIVALSPRQYWSVPGGNRCWNMIRVYYQGKNIDARVVDRCDTCEGDSIDLALSGFEMLALANIGVLRVDWEYI